MLMARVCTGNTASHLRVVQRCNQHGLLCRRGPTLPYGAGRQWPVSVVVRQAARCASAQHAVAVLPRARGAAYTGVTVRRDWGFRNQASPRWAAHELQWISGYDSGTLFVIRDAPQTAWICCRFWSIRSSGKCPPTLRTQVWDAVYCMVVQIHSQPCGRCVAVGVCASSAACCHRSADGGHPVHHMHSLKQAVITAHAGHARAQTTHLCSSADGVLVPNGQLSPHLVTKSHHSSLRTVLGTHSDHSGELRSGVGVEPFRRLAPG